MAKLTKLSVEQERLMSLVRDQYISRVFILECDREAARKGVEWLYSLSGLKNPVVVFVSSPLAVQYAANFLKRIDQVGAQVMDQVGAQVRSQVRSQVGAQVGAQVMDQVWSQVGAQVGAQVWSQVGAQVRSQVRSQVGAQVGAQVMDQVWSQVGAQVSDQVVDQVEREKLTYFSLSEDVFETWTSFYQYFTEIGIINHDKFNTLYQYVQSNVWFSVFLEGIAILGLPPVRCDRDVRGRLHNTVQSAIEWSDGYEQYYVHGVSFSKELFEEVILDKPSSARVLELDNVEQRTAVLETHGWELLINSCTLIDSMMHMQKGINKPTQYRLYRVNDTRIPVNVLYGEWWEKGELRYFYETTPRELMTVFDTVPWMFYIDNPLEYWDQLEIET